jgi:hypothetical protein
MVMPAEFRFPSRADWIITLTRYAVNGIYLDNVTLVAASLVPFKAHWQEVADELPAEESLIVLPCRTKQQRVVRFVASQLSGKGNHV